MTSWTAAMLRKRIIGIALMAPAILALATLAVLAAGWVTVLVTVGMIALCCLFVVGLELCLAHR